VSHSPNRAAPGYRYNSAMPVLLSNDEGAVRVLSLNRPRSRNALDGELRRALTEALAAAEAEPGVRAVVLTGNGAAFCAGMDLAELETLLDRSPEQHLEDSRRLGELFLRLHSFPKPVVAAVNGHAVAGGAGLAVACDVVVIAEEARIGFSEARIGFVAALVGVLLARSVGERLARELLLEARLLGGREAVERGLANEAVPAAEVLGRAVERARAIAEGSPQALAATKRLLLESSGLPVDEALELAARVNASARSGEDLREGIRAFLEKRRPAWSVLDGGED
jgi:methylglutaconyl-CoA hydratase